MKPKIQISYCVKCRWLLRAAWLAQELLTTFESDLASVALAPGDVGEFIIQVDDQIVWNRKAAGRFPEAKEIKQRVRDIIDPSRDLGHSDTNNPNTDSNSDTSD